MGVRALSAVGARLNIFFGVIPQSAGVGHEQRKQQTADDITGQKSADSLNSADKADADCSDNRNQPGGYQLAERAVGRNLDTLVVFGGNAFPALFKSGYLAELAADFSNHPLCVFVHTKHKHCRKQRGYRRADKQAEEDRRVHDVKPLNQLHSQFGRNHIDFADKSAEQRDYRKAGRADRKALCDGLDSVAGAVEGVGNLQHVLSQIAHLGKPSGVVHNRPVRVIGYNHPDNREHTNRGHRNAEHRITVAQRLANLVRAQGGNTDTDQRGQGAHKTVGNAGQYGERRARLGGFSDVPDGLFVVVCEKVGRNPNQHAHNQSDCGRPPNPPLKVKRPCGNRCEHSKNRSGYIGAAVKRAGGVAFFANPRGRNPKNGRQQPNRRIAENHADVELAAGGFVEGRGYHQRGRHGRHVGVEQIRAHARDVADIVSDVVSDNRRVARVVFGYAELHLPAKVGADIRGFGEYPAARLCEQRERACAKAEPQQSGGVAGNIENKRNPKKAGAHNRKTHNRSAPETRHEGRADTFFSGFGGFHIGDGRDLNSDFPRYRGKNGARDISEGHGEVLTYFILPNRGWKEQKYQNSGDARKLGEGNIFLREKSVCAAAD